MRTGPLLLGAAVLTAVAGTAAGTVALTAVPAHAASCESGEGVTVVVDFASLGGGTRTGCAAGDPASGIAALRGAGHEPTRAAQQPGYFVCRIDGKPASDPCQRASPANAYWSYWHAEPGGTWTFSNTGAADYDPKPGTVEGWAFGDGKPPSTPPPREQSAPPPDPEPSPSPKAQQPAAPKPAAEPTRETEPERSAAPAATAEVTEPSPAVVLPTVTASAAASPSASPSGRATPSPTESPSPAPVATVDPQQDDGSVTGPVIALLLVALLLAAAATQMWLRRSRAESA